MKEKVNLVAGMVCVVLLIRYIIVILTGALHTIFLHMSAIAAAFSIVAVLISYVATLKHKQQRKE